MTIPPGIRHLLIVGSCLAAAASGLAADLTPPKAPPLNNEGFTVPIPEGWATKGAGGNSYYQASSNGCFHFVDAKTRSYLARVCTSDKPWDDVSARAKQLAFAYSEPRIKRETLTTPGGATYHINRWDGRIATSIILEGKDNLLLIEVDATLEVRDEVTRRLISLLDQVVWQSVGPNIRRYIAAESTPNRGIDQTPTQELCNAVYLADTARTRALLGKRKFDVFATCPPGDTPFIEWLADYHEEAWIDIQNLLPDNQRRSMLNARLLKQLFKPYTPQENLTSRLSNLKDLVAAGAQPTYADGSNSWSALSHLLQAPVVPDPAYSEAAAKFLVDVIESLPQTSKTPEQLGNDFSTALLGSSRPQEQIQLVVLRQLKKKYGLVEFWSDKNRLLEESETAHPTVRELVSQLQPVR